LATRKVCHFREIEDSFHALSATAEQASGAVDNNHPQPYLCAIASRAMALILLRFWPLNLGLLYSHSFGGSCSADAASPSQAKVLVMCWCCGASGWDSGQARDVMTAAAQTHKGRMTA
jgi:hypothetical protein